VSRVAVLLVVLAAAGCVTTGSTPPDVGNFKGQASQPILAKLGPPESRDSVAGGTVYRWRSAVRQESAAVQATVVDYSSGRPMANRRRSSGRRPRRARSASPSMPQAGSATSRATAAGRPARRCSIGWACPDRARIAVDGRRGHAYGRRTQMIPVGETAVMAAPKEQPAPETLRQTDRRRMGLWKAAGFRTGARPPTK